MSDDGEVMVVRATKRKRRGDTLTAEELAERQARKAVKIEDSEEMHETVEVLKDDKVEEEGNTDNTTSQRRKKNSVDPEKEDMVKYRTVKRYMTNFKSLETISFDKAKAMIKANPSCGLQAVRERRHLTIPFHLLGGNVSKTHDYVTKQTIGKYRKEVRGVVLAIGSVTPAANPRIIDDQLVAHSYINVTQIVFRPVPKHVYECHVQHISNTFVAGLLLESISISMPVDQNMKKALKGVTLEIGDVVEVKYESITINRGLCQLRGSFLKMLKKGVKTEAKHVPDSKAHVALNKKTTFCETDDESE